MSRTSSSPSKSISIRISIRVRLCSVEIIESTSNLHERLYTKVDRTAGGVASLEGQLFSFSGRCGSINVHAYK